MFYFTEVIVLDTMRYIMTFMHANILESVQHRFFRLLSFKIGRGMKVEDHD